MKKQTKLNIKVRDLEPLKDVTAGRRRHRSHDRALRLSELSRRIQRWLRTLRTQQDSITNMERTARGRIPRCGS